MLKYAWDCSIEQLRLLLRRETVRPAKRTAVLGGGLAVGSDRRGLCRRGGGVVQHSGTVAGRFSVVCEAGEIGLTRRLGERGEHAAVEVAPPDRRDRLLDCEPGQLVAERDGPVDLDDEPGSEALVEVFAGPAADRIQEPRLDSWWGDGNGLDDGARAIAESCRSREDRIADGLRDLAVSRLEHRSDEEGVSARPAVEDAGVERAAVGEACHSLDRQWFEPQTSDARGRGQLAEQHPNRVRTVELVVAIRCHDERGGGLDPAPDDTHDVQRRLVGPVHVLDHENRRAALELLQESTCDIVRPPSGAHQLVENAACFLAHLDERPQRPRRGERVAGAPEDACRARDRAAERPHEHGLADACLAGDEHQPTRAGPSLRMSAVQRSERLLALEQVSGSSRLTRDRGHEEILPPALTAAQVLGAADRRRSSTLVGSRSFPEPNRRSRGAGDRGCPDRQCRGWGRHRASSRCVAFGRSRRSSRRDRRRRPGRPDNGHRPRPGDGHRRLSDRSGDGARRPGRAAPAHRRRAVSRCARRLLRIDPGRGRCGADRDDRAGRARHHRRPPRSL